MAKYEEITHTYGEKNLNLFIKAGWEIVGYDSAPKFTKYILRWSADKVPVRPSGTSNPWQDWLKIVNDEYEKEKARLEELIARQSNS